MRRVTALCIKTDIFCENEDKAILRLEIVKSVDNLSVLRNSYRFCGFR